MADLAGAITLPTWQNVIHRANQGERPPEPHLLLRDARARLRRKQYQYSAIFSGIAAEIVIKNQVEHELRIRGNPQPFIDQIVNDTLGRLVRTCKTFNISLPSHIRQDLIEVRNRAIHTNAVITRDEAKKALDMASGIVVDMVPL